MAKLPGQDSNLDKESQNLSQPRPNPLSANTSGDTAVPVARQLPNDPDFARLAAVWPKLPEHVRRTIISIADNTLA
jgi:hypothetical protein